MTFEEAGAEARQRVSTERLAKAVTQWLQDLRARTDVVSPYAFSRRRVPVNASPQATFK